MSDLGIQGRGWGTGKEGYVHETLKLAFLCGLGGSQFKEERFLGNQVTEENALYCTGPRGCCGSAEEALA